MRIVFMGSPDFAVASLEKLISAGHNIVSVVTGTDKRRGRGNELTPTPVKASAENNNIPVIEVEDLRSESFANSLKQLKADLFVVVAFRVLPKSILAIPAIGSVNLHASLLPAYRGAAPIHRAVMNGETQTGATVFFLDERVDTGNYIAQQTIDIHPDETTGELYNRMMVMGAELLESCLVKIREGSYHATPQDDSLATAAPKLFSEDCLIDFSKPAHVVHNQIRGLSPFPTAFTLVDGKRLKVYRSALGPIVTAEIGKLIFDQQKLLVVCADNTSIELLEVQIEGKKRTDGISFWNGYQGSARISTDS